jgi:ribosome-associated toxin RatA of RatAB toxin-antitoxin module
MRALCCLTLLSALLAVQASASAAQKPQLRTLPQEKLEGMGRMLAQGDLALIESDEGGRLRQITVMTLVAAPVSVVHDVVADLASYQQFVSNMSESNVSKNTDGTIDLSFVIRYTVVGFSGTERHWFRDDGSIDLDATDPNDRARFRWEFHPTQGGTVLVMYGFTDVMHSPDLIKTMVSKAPSLEHGLALASQLVEVRAMKMRAEKLAGPSPELPVSHAQVPGWDFLLDRGQVVGLRFAPSGKLADIAVRDRVNAPGAKLEAALASPGEYARFTDSMPKSKEVKRGAEGITYEATIDLPVASWDSKYVMRSGPKTADVTVIDGDLRGARYRWEIIPSAADRSVILFRAKQDLSASSLALRALFKQEPLFEPGFDAALGLIAVNGIRARAEGRR